MLKNLEFELVMEPTEKESEDIEKLRIDTIDELKKIEQEIAFISSKSST